MPADQPRTRTVGCKMTDNEYERLSAVAEGDGMTLGEWVREVTRPLSFNQTQFQIGCSRGEKKARRRDF